MIKLPMVKCTMLLLCLLAGLCADFLGGTCEEYVVKWCGKYRISVWRTEIYWKLIDLYSIKNNVPPILIAKIIRRESQFDKNTVGDDGASFGLMGIKAESWEGKIEYLHRIYGKTNFTRTELLFIPKVSIALGTEIFREKLKESNGDFSLALIAYNAGINSGLYKRAKENINFKYRNSYVRNVLDDK